MKFPVIFRTPSLLIPGLGHWEKLDREPLDHAFWLLPADAYRINVEGDEETGHMAHQQASTSAVRRALNNHQNAERALGPHNQKGRCFQAVPTLF